MKLTGATATSNYGWDSLDEGVIVYEFPELLPRPGQPWDMDPTKGDET